MTINPVLEQTKKCTKCGEIKPLSAYHVESRHRDGRFSACVVCHSKSSKAWKLKNPKKVLAYDRKHYWAHKEQIAEYRAAHPERFRMACKKYAAKNPDKRNAKNALNNAVSAGKIERQNQCQCCGDTGRIEAHHPSYKKEHWLDVIWLCKKCHENIHTAKTEESK